MAKKLFTEEEIEKAFVNGIKEVGGIAYKFTSPGNAGVPDRLVCMPGGTIIFVELKTETGKLSKIQKMQIGRLDAINCYVHVLYGMEDIANFFELYGYTEIARRIKDKVKRRRKEIGV